jgi:branched-chain amino acid transport system ATP-binding protein
MLKLEHVSARYGGLLALSDVSLEVNTGELVAVIGPNGAGKTTLFKAISGIVPLSGGRITFEGRDLADVAAASRPHLGIAHVPEYRQVFGGLTVAENLRLGTTPLGARSDGGQNIEKVLEMFPVLRDRLDQLAGTLSGGQQQMLAIGRGLVSSPKLLMLDEPSMGLSPAIVDAIFAQIARMRREANLMILLVEQRAVEALELCDRAYVLSTGHLVTSGSGVELLRNDRVNRAYLGR